jgi:hypothetical protein
LYISPSVEDEVDTTNFISDLIKLSKIIRMFRPLDSYKICYIHRPIDIFNELNNSKHEGVYIT